MATASELLDDVNDAIEAILSGRPIQRYTAGGIDVQNVSLTDLYQLRRQLIREVNLDDAGGRVLLADVRRRAQ